MTDRFEEAVRDAVQGLPSAAPDMPTYHGAWDRGRRRRLIKRSALAAAGACLFVAALAVNVGRIPGSGTTEVDDIATSLDVATAVVEPTPLATTSPLETPDPSSASSTAPTLAVPTPTTHPERDLAEDTGPTAVEPAPTTPPPAAEPTPSAESTESSGSADTVEPAPTAPAVTSTATPVPEAPTVEPAPSPVETADADPSASGPAEPGGDGDLLTETDPGQAAGTAQQPADSQAPTDTEPGGQLSFTGPGPGDAVVLDAPSGDGASPCDLDGDLIADASCELLADYACTGNGDVRAGYSAIDSNGDQLADTCVALDITVCDTVFDGAGDTPCIIELLPAGGATNPPGGSEDPEG